MNVSINTGQRFANIGLVGTSLYALLTTAFNIYFIPFQLIVTTLFFLQSIYNFTWIDQWIKRIQLLLLILIVYCAIWIGEFEGLIATISTAIVLSYLQSDHSTRYAQLMFACFVGITLSATISNDLSFAICLIIFVICGFFSLCLNHLRMGCESRLEVVQSKGNHKQGKIDRLLRSRRLIPLDTLFIWAITLVGLISLSILIFYIIPRFQPRLGMEHSLYHESGFSEHIRLDGRGIHLSDQIVFRSSLFEINTTSTTQRLSTLISDSNRKKIPSLEPRYWRGRTLTLFDGKDWMPLDHMDRDTLVPIQQNIWTDQRKKLSQSKSYTVELIHMEDRHHLSLFTSATPEIIEFPSFQTQHRLVTFKSGDMHFTAKDNFLVLFAYSHSINMDQKIDASTHFNRNLIDDAGAEVIHAALQLPVNLDRRVRQFAQQLSQRSTDQKSMIDMLKHYFNSEFTYTNRLERRSSQDLTAHFLFENKAGWCEHFSSAFTVLLRLVKIPARIVIGYQGGEWNQVDYSWLVRQLHAHAWVEVYQGGDPLLLSSWKRVDPTPQHAQHTAQNRHDLESHWFDRFSILWEQQVLAFEFIDYQEIWRNFWRMIGDGKKSKVAQESNTIRESNLQTTVSIWSISVFTGLIFALFYLYRKLLFHRSNDDFLVVHKEQLASLIDQLSHRLEPFGLGLSSTEKIESWIRRIETEQSIEYQPIIDWLTEYQRIRFGSKNFSRQGWIEEYRDLQKKLVVVLQLLKIQVK